MIQELGETEISQSLKAYNASIILSGDTPAARWINISTFSAVLSSIFFNLILPFSLALIIESIRFDVVLPKGISVIESVLLSTLLIFARILIAPPLRPSLYLDTSTMPPVGKSG
ncbi:hypothetical protein ES705_48651 [subsurface metagenome]